jgi:hypothetical protein
MTVHFLIRPTALAALSATVFAATANAEIVYAEDFEAAGPGSAVDGFDVSGGFNDRGTTELVTDGGATVNNTVVAFFDTNGAGFPTTTQFVVDTGVVFEPQATYTLSLDLFKVSPDQPAFEGDFFYEIYLGDPSADGSTGTLIAAGTAGGTTDGALSVSGSLADGTGTVYLRFDSTIPSNTGGYAQVELDNLVLEAVPIPEPTSAAVLGLVGGLMLCRRR